MIVLAGVPARALRGDIDGVCLARFEERVELGDPERDVGRRSGVAEAAETGVEECVMAIAYRRIAMT